MNKRVERSRQNGYWIEAKVTLDFESDDARTVTVDALGDTMAAAITKLWQLLPSGSKLETYWPAGDYDDYYSEKEEMGVGLDV